MIFTYRSKGTNDDWTTDIIEAANQEEAWQKLDTIYGLVRDENGVQVDADMIQVEILTTRGD